MGLDQYLSKKTYIKNWDHMQPNEKHTLTVKGPRAKKIDPKKVAYIEEEVMYWRKANQIHKWFVDNCQDGEDDCRTAWVSHDQLKELVDICKRILKSSELIEGEVVESYTFSDDGKKIKNMTKGKVMANTALAEELLPSQSGFFFGGTDYDEWYYKDLKDTVEALEPLLDDQDSDAMVGTTFYYSSSW